MPGQNRASETGLSRAGLSELGPRLFHFFHGGDFDLTNPLGADAVLIGQIVQSHAA